MELRRDIELYLYTPDDRVSLSSIRRPGHDDRVPQTRPGWFDSRTAQYRIILPEILPLLSSLSVSHPITSRHICYLFFICFLFLFIFYLMYLLLTM